MTTKILASISAYQASIGVWRGNGFSACATVANDETGWSSFRELIQRHKNAPVWLMVDGVEEDYRNDSLPHVFGSGRNEMIQRKLDQLFRATPYRAALIQGRESDRRKDDRVLFMAFSNTELLKPWLEIIQGQAAPLAGIFPISLASQPLLNYCGIKDQEVLLVSIQGGGLRQSFFRNGQLKISRLSPQTENIEINATQCAAEIEKTRLYLINSKLLPRDSQLHAYVLDEFGVAGNIPQHMHTDQNFVCRVLTRDQLDAGLPAAKQWISQCPDSRVMACLAQSPPKASLAAPKLRTNYRLHLARLALYAASVLFFFGAILWSGFNLWKQSSMEDEAFNAALRTRHFVSMYQQEARQFPEAPTSADKLKKAVAVAGELKRYTLFPGPFMTLLSQAMTEQPEIYLNRMTWIYGKPDSAGIGHNLPAEADIASTRTAQGNPALWKQTGYIDAEIRPFNGDYRAATDSVNRFAKRLKKIPGIEEVNIIRLPLNADSSATLTGHTQESTRMANGLAQFQLKITLKGEAP